MEERGGEEGGNRNPVFAQVDVCGEGGKGGGGRGGGRGEGGKGEFTRKGNPVLILIHSAGLA